MTCTLISRCAGLFLAALVMSSVFVASSHAAGALAVGKCGAYGQAFDYRHQNGAIAAARKQCSGDCTVVTMKRACAAFALDMKNPCGSFGYAVESRISSALNAASKKCYAYGGKDCVIRAWACDARG